MTGRRAGSRRAGRPGKPDASPASPASPAPSSEVEPSQPRERAPLPRAGVRTASGSRKLSKEHRPRIVSLRPDAVALVVIALVLLAGVAMVVTSIGGDSGRQREAVTTTGSPGSEDLAVDAASRVLGAWSQPSRGYRDWWEALSPMLTPGGRQAYAYTDPRKVPELGDLTTSDVRMSAAGTTATVYFETSAGRYGVDLSWKSSAGEWLANRVVFPGRESMFG